MGKRIGNSNGKEDREQQWERGQGTAMGKRTGNSNGKEDKGKAMGKKEDTEKRWGRKRIRKSNGEEDKGKAGEERG